MSHHLIEYGKDYEFYYHVRSDVELSPREAAIQAARDVMTPSHLKHTILVRDKKERTYKINLSPDWGYMK